MYSPRLRFGLIVLLLVSGFAVLFVYQYWVAVLMLWSTALLLMFGHFRYGSIIATLWALRQGNIEKASELLAAIKRPQWLSRRYRAYYFFCLGLVAFYRKQMDEGVAHFNESLAQGLSGKQELAIAHLNLAHAAYIRQDWDSCRQHIETVKAQKTEDLFMKQRIEELEKQLSSK
jgi:hypothetical protein